MNKRLLTEIEDCFGITHQHQLRHTNIFCQGDEVDHVYIIKDGWVMLYEHLADGRRQVLKFAGPGMLLGLKPSSSKKIKYTAECLTNVNFKSISYSHLEQMICAKPDIGLLLIDNEVQEREDLFNRLTDIGRCSARERIAHLLVDMACQIQSLNSYIKTNYGILIPPVTRRDIGDSLGLSNEHVSRVFRCFKDESLINTYHNRINILDLHGLSKIAGVKLKIDALPNQELRNKTY